MDATGENVRFKEIVSRLSGFSTPIFGVSWNPRTSEVEIARSLVAFLEDRRVLYNPSEVEVPMHCVHSVIQIRRYLTHQLAQLPDDSSLAESIRAMRAACRKFLDAVGSPDDGILPFGAVQGHYASWIFNTAVGELRGVVGVHVAQVAARHGLDVEDQLATILPEKDEQGTDAAA